MPANARPLRDLGLTIAEVLRAAYEEQGMSLKRLGEVSGVDYTQLSRFMRGQKPMVLDEYVAICEALGLDPIRVLADAIERVEAACAAAEAPEPEPVEPEFIITSVADLPEDDYDYAPGELEALAAREGHAPDIQEAELELP